MQWYGDTVSFIGYSLLNDKTGSTRTVSLYVQCQFKNPVSLETWGGLDQNLTGIGRSRVWLSSDKERLANDSSAGPRSVIITRPLRLSRHANGSSVTARV